MHRVSERLLLSRLQSDAKLDGLVLLAIANFDLEGFINPVVAGIDLDVGPFALAIAQAMKCPAPWPSGSFSWLYAA